MPLRRRPNRAVEGQPSRCRCAAAAWLLVLAAARLRIAMHITYRRLTLRASARLPGEAASAIVSR